MSTLRIKTLEASGTKATIIFPAEPTAEVRQRFEQLCRATNGVVSLAPAQQPANSQL